MTRHALGLLTTLALLLPAPSALAVIAFDQNVTPNVIYGSGNNNGSFTVDRTSGVELGLRGKLRFDANNQGQNIFNSNGDGTYTFNAGHPDLSLPRPSWADATTPIWNFDWHINSNFDGTPAYPNVASLNYRIDIDFHNAAGITSFLSFNPVTAATDNSYGDNSTAQGQGVETNMPALFNVAQNSWNMEFFDAPASTFSFDPNVGGEYTFVLSAFDPVSSTQVASSTMNILVTAVPEASSLLAVGLAGLASAAVVIVRKRLAA